MSLDIGQALGRTFSPISGNAGTMLGVGALLAGVPAALVAALEFDAAGGAIFAPGAQAAPFTPAYGAALLVQILLGLLAQAALIHTAVAYYRGRRIGFGEAFGIGVRHVLPLLVISILLTLGITLGLVLLVVPGLFLMVKWSVAIPAQVEESAGIIGSFKRSWALTAGSWWGIFGFVVLLLLVLLVAILLVSVVIGLAVAGLSLLGGPVALGAVVVLQIVLGTAQTVIGAGAAAALYFGLRAGSEGSDAESLRETFA